MIHRIIVLTVALCGFETLSLIHRMISSSW